MLFFKQFDSCKFKKFYLYELIGLTIMKMKEGVEMKYLVTFVWGFILSQVTYYLGSALAQSPYNFTNAVVVGVLISCGIVFIQHVFMKPTKTAPQEHQ